MKLQRWAICINVCVIRQTDSDSNTCGWADNIWWADFICLSRSVLCTLNGSRTVCNLFFRHFWHIWVKTQRLTPNSNTGYDEKRRVDEAKRQHILIIPELSRRDSTKTEAKGVTLWKRAKLVSFIIKFSLKLDYPHMTSIYE